jgi:hypothetical protein
MIDFRRLEKVARFELRDALRSRLVAAGAGLGALIFVKSMQGAEEMARVHLARSSGLPIEAIPIAEVRDQAITGLIKSVKDEGLRDALLGMQPLAIFYGYVSLFSVPLLVLMLSGGTHAADLQSGAARFSLFRCNRPTWALGKLVGHALLLGLGLLVGALAAGLVGSSYQPEFETHTWGDLLFASLRAWIYGVTYLGIFSGISLISGAPLRARALSLFVLMGCGLGHLVATSDWLLEKAEMLGHLKWLFPGQYETGLWLSDPVAFLTSASALLALGAAGLSLGTYSFMRRDA